MANAINNTKDAGYAFAKMGATVFEDNLAFCKSISKTQGSEFHGNSGYSHGDTITIPLPARSAPTSAFDQTSTIQDISEKNVPITLDIISSSAFEVNSLEFATEIQMANVFERLIKPAMIDLAHDFEYKVIDKAMDATANSVGTAGANTFDPDVILTAREKLGRNLCPKDGNRFFLFDGAAGRKAVGARKGLFQDSTEISKQYKTGMVGIADGFTWLESEMVSEHTNGNDVVFEVSTTVSTQGATSLVVEGLTTTTGTVTKGTVFTVAGVYAVNPQTKRQYDHLQQFVVTADATANGSGIATLSVSPAMYTTGANQNISGFPTDGDAITPVGSASTSYVQNLAYHKDAYRLATAPLVMPKSSSVQFAGQYRYKGMNVAIVYDWDQLKRSMVLRLDILGALAAPRPEWACRVTS